MSEPYDVDRDWIVGNERDGKILVAARQPHLGYALVFGAIAFVLVQVALIVLLAVGESLHWLPKGAAMRLHDFPKLSVLAMLISYVGAAGVAAWFFPRLWHRSFGNVLEWNGTAAATKMQILVGLGIFLSLAAQGAQHFLPIPKSMPMDDFFRTRSDAWVMMLFGTLVAPAFEELLFRGFLLRGLAIAWDWLRLSRTDEARSAWQATDSLSRSAVVFSAIVTSLGFAVMHAAQLAHAWSTVAVLWGVGLVLTWVRLYFRSLAASTLVHASYNGFIFVIMFVYTGGFMHLERMTR